MRSRRLRPVRAGRSRRRSGRGRARLLIQLLKICRRKLPRLRKKFELETGTAWHAHLGSFAAFRQGVVELLARRKAAIADDSPRAFGDRPHQTMIGSPEEIGTRLASFASQRSRRRQNRRARRRWMENAWRELVAFQQRQERGDTNNGK